VRSTRSLQRGDVVRVRLDPTEGSEQAGERPALILSPDVINEHSPVVLIASITSRKTDRIYPFEALVEPPEGGLTRRGKVMLMQLRSVDKRRLTGHYGVLGEETMHRVEEALMIATGLMPL
jgi:mRNA interferase MazF